MQVWSKVDFGTGTVTFLDDTRKEDMLLTDKELSTVWQMRKAFSNLDTAEATETLLDGMKRSKTNEELCRNFGKYSPKN